MTYLQLSRTQIRNKVISVLNEAEAGVVVSDAPPSGIPDTGPVDLTGLKNAAAQAIGALQALSKQAVDAGFDVTDISDMIDQINSDFGLVASPVDLTATMAVGSSSSKTGA